MALKKEKKKKKKRGKFRAFGENLEKKGGGEGAKKYTSSLRRQPLENVARRAPSTIRSGGKSLKEPISFMLGSRGGNAEIAQ